MSDYLIHFNKNHDKKSGRFTFGDGDEDGELSERQRHKIEEKDNKWARKNYDKLVNKAYKPVRREMNTYLKKELNPKYRDQLRKGKVSRSYMNEYNSKLAELMNRDVGSLTAPSGRVVQFIAKRGEIGVHMALADPGYDMSQFKRGVYGSGRVAYKKTHVNMA